MKPADTLQLTQPAETDGPWIASVGESTPMRLSPPLGKILRWLADETDAPVEDFVGQPVSKAELDQALAMLKDAGLVVDNIQQPEPAELSKPPGRLKFKSLFSIQFAVFNRPEQFAWLSIFARRSWLVAAASACAALAVAGVMLTGFCWPEFEAALTSPLPVPTIILILFAIIISVSLHEFSHALTLIYYGGNVRRMGVMLFYLSPAFFCDVTDAWRLPRKEQRSVIALAGVVATFGIAGSFSILYVMTGSRHYWMAILAIGLFVESLANLIPFIKLDGYIALMTYLDEPSLRTKTMREWKEAALLATCGEYAALRTYRMWRLGYGLASSATPLIIVALAAGTIGSASGGIVGSALSAALIWVSVFLMGRGIYSLFRIAPNACTVSPVRRAFVLIAALGTLALAGLIPVREHNTAAYWVSGKNLVTFLADESYVDRTVRLQRDGVLAGHHLGDAVVTSQTITAAVPIQALAPNISTEGFLAEKTVRVLSQQTGEPTSTPGTLILGTKTQPLGAWLANTALLRRLDTAGKQ